jgi:hypothetical protein
MNPWDHLKSSRLRKWYDYASNIGKPHVLFVWVPKNAGSSVYKWLHESIGMEKQKRPRRFKNFSNNGPVTFSHVHYLSLLKAGYVSASFHEKAYKFAITRDPYDRALSLYKYVAIKEKKFEGSMIDFLEMVRLKRPPVGLYNTAGISQANPQVDWIMGDDEQFIVDDLFRVEEINAMYAMLSSMFLVNKTTSPTWENKSQMNNDHLWSHDETIPLIEHIYERDFDLLGYEKISVRTSAG